MKKVQILLSTYNGEKYLDEQMESLINQEYPNYSILIRDDGSTDNTTNIIKKYADKYNYISYSIGENLGVIKSFFELVKNCDKTADYYSFCDQDDVWDKLKIKEAVRILESKEENSPLLYCGSTTLVDKNLKILKDKTCKTIIKPSFGNALVENICTGCTIVINQMLMNHVYKTIPEFTVMHDWWFYLNASCFGQVYFDDRSFIYYRQHDSNVVGSRSSVLHEFICRVKRFKTNRGKISRQAKEFYRLNTIPMEHLILIKVLIGYKDSLSNKIAILLSNKIYRQRLIDNIIFKILFMLGII